MSSQQKLRFCTSRDGVRIAYATVGRGPPLVKAANWLAHLEFDWRSPVWRHWLAELSRGRKLVRYDERGSGLSDRDVADLSFEAWIADLEAVVDAADLDRFALLGISQGGAIAIAYAARHPERVSHLVLYGAYARGRQARARSQEEREEADMMIRMIELGWGKENPAFRQAFSTQFMPDGSPEQYRWFNELQRISAAPTTAAQLLREIDTVNVYEAAQQISCPTLVLHADRDQRVAFEEGRLLAGTIPGARFVPLEGSNHILMEAEPAWVRFCEELQSFLPEPATTRQPNEGSLALSGLTRREQEIVELIAAGLDNRNIAARLFISEKTIRNHITNVFSKLGVETRAQAIVRAREAGFGSGTGSR